MYEYPAPGPITTTVKLAGGARSVSAEQRETATVDVQPFDNSEASRQAAENIKVEMRGADLIVEAPEGGSWLFRRGARLRVDIRLPLDSRLHVKLASADARCVGRYAEATLSSASGDVYVEETTGDVTAQTASGDVTVGRAGGRVKAQTASGSVNVQYAGGDLTVNSASGDARVDVAGDSVKANTASGDIDLGLVRQGTVKIHSASGDVRVGVLAGTAVWLDLSTMSGETSSDLNVGGGDVPPSGSQMTLQVRTMSGDIEIHRVVPPTSAANSQAASA